MHTLMRMILSNFAAHSAIGSNRAFAQLSTPVRYRMVSILLLSFDADTRAHHAGNTSPSHRDIITNSECITQRAHERA
jgi:hypothetical protein